MSVAEVVFACGNGTWSKVFHAAYDEILTLVAMEAKNISGCRSGWSLNPSVTLKWAGMETISDEHFQTGAC